MRGRTTTTRRVLARMIAGTVALGSLAGCGPNLTTLAFQAMDACVVQRNPMFKSGRGAEALATPLPAAAQQMATRLAYPRGLKAFKEVATSASDQVTLVCALDIISLNPDVDATRFIERYLKHPSPDVAASARILLDRRQR